MFIISFSQIGIPCLHPFPVFQIHLFSFMPGWLHTGIPQEPLGITTLVVSPHPQVILFSTLSLRC